MDVDDNVPVTKLVKVKIAMSRNNQSICGVDVNNSQLFQIITSLSPCIHLKTGSSGPVGQRYLHMEGTNRFLLTS